MTRLPNRVKGDVMRRQLAGLKARRAPIALAVVAATALAGVPTMAAQAATSGGGTATASITGGSLSVGTIGTMTALAPAIGASGTGALPSAQWADGTGLGLGWNGTVAISPLSYTGAWVASSGAVALTSTAAGTYSGTDDGKFYTVTVTGVPTATTTPFSWTSDATADSAGGSGTATNGTATTIGTHGIAITFAAATTYVATNSYTVLVGTQAASSMVVNTATGATITSTGTTSTAPTYANNTSAIAAGATVGTVNAAGAVKVIDALVGTGASGTGYYTAAPGVQLTADTSSWAKTYSASLTYTIVSGP